MSEGFTKAAAGYRQRDTPRKKIRTNTTAGGERAGEPLPKTRLPVSIAA